MGRGAQNHACEPLAPRPHAAVLSVSGDVVAPTATAQAGKLQCVTAELPESAVPWPVEMSSAAAPAPIADDARCRVIAAALNLRATLARDGRLDDEFVETTPTRDGAI